MGASDWYEFRSLAPRDWTLTVLVVATFVTGMVLVGRIIDLASSEDLHENDRFGAAGMGALGVALIVAATTLLRSLRAQRFNYGDPFLRVDDYGVWIRTGTDDADTAASVPWSAVASVELTSRTLRSDVAQSGHGILDVLRFVLSDESAVQHDPFPPAVAEEATALGLSHAAAALCLISSPSHAAVTTQLLQWLSVNYPDLPIRDERRHR